jgi:hypothetical protein
VPIKCEKCAKPMGNYMWAPMYMWQFYMVKCM